MEKNRITLLRYSGPILAPSVKGFLIATGLTAWIIAIWALISLGVTMKDLSYYAESRFNENILMPILYLIMGIYIISIIVCISDAIYTAIKYGDSLIRA